MRVPARHLVCCARVLEEAPRAVHTVVPFGGFSLRNGPIALMYRQHRSAVLSMAPSAFAAG
jgi:hypothetical protein